MGCAPVARGRSGVVRRVNARPVTTTVGDTVEGSLNRSIARRSILKNGNGMHNHTSGRSSSNVRPTSVTFTDLPPKVLGSDQTRDSVQVYRSDLNRLPEGSIPQQQDFPAVQMITSVVTPQPIPYNQFPQELVPANQHPPVFFSFQEHDVGAVEPAKELVRAGNTHPSFRTNDEQQQGNFQGMQPDVNYSYSTGFVQPAARNYSLQSLQMAPRLGAGSQTMRQYHEVLQLSSAIPPDYTLPVKARQFPFPQLK